MPFRPIHQELLAPAPTLVNTVLFFILDAMGRHTTSMAPPVLAGDAIAAVAFAGARALENDNVLRSKSLRTATTTAISVVFGGMAGGAEATVTGRPVVHGIFWAMYSAGVAAFTMSTIAPANGAEEPGPPYATRQGLAADPWRQDGSGRV